MNPSLDPGLSQLPLLDVTLLALASMPYWTSLLLLLAGASLFTLIGALLLGAAQDPMAAPAGPVEGNFLSGAKFGFLGEVFAALLAFVLVDGGIRYASAREQVQVEASAMRLFDAVIADLADPSNIKVRQELRIYARAVSDHEFRTMQWGQQSATAQGSFRQLVDRYIGLSDTTEQDRLIRLQADQFLTTMLESRQKRLQSARPGQRTLIWTVFLSNTLIAIGFSWLFRTRSLAAHVLMAVVMTSALMVVIHLAILLYHPFTGALAISAAPYQTLPAL
jgi:hypothetical protein